MSFHPAIQELLSRWCRYDTEHMLLHFEHLKLKTAMPSYTIASLLSLVQKSLVFQQVIMNMTGP